MLQSVGVATIPDLSSSVFVSAGGTGILDSWDHREVMIKCDQEQSLKSLAELFQEQRRPRSRMVENTRYDLEGLVRTRRSDPIEGTGASINVESLLAPRLVSNWAWNSTRFAIDVAGLSDFKRQCGKDFVGESLREAICQRKSVRIQPEMESRWKADGVFMGKLDLSDEVIVGVEKMRIADDIVCYSTAISACVEEQNSLMALALFKKNRPMQHAQRPDCVQSNDQCMWKKACLGPWGYICCVRCKTYSGMSVTTGWRSLEHCTEAQGGKRVRWRRDKIMDNTMFNACEKDDQRSIELKMLVEHGERDSISFNSVSRACAVNKQQEKELTVFRSMGAKCVEKMHRSNNVLQNALRRKPPAASVLQQAETGCAKEQELFQSLHASILEPGATAQPSFNSSHEKSMQLNTSPRRATITEDDVATVRPRLGMSAMISVLCERDVPETDWEKLVKAGRESEVKRMLEFELFEEVSEELTSGKRIWNSAWLDSQEKSGVARSALAENQISGGQCDDVFC